MQFYLSKEEIIDILHNHVEGLFNSKSEISISLGSKPKTGIYAHILVQRITNIKENKPTTQLKDLVVEDTEEVVEEKEIKESVVTSGSIFSNINA